MHKPTHKVIDSVSASELLKALNTLKSMNCPQTEFQISFSKENIIRSDDFPQSANTIHYQDFIAKKRTPKTNKNIYNNKLISPSPLREVRCNIPTRTSNFKSRSHSPLDKRSERTNSRISNTSKYQIKQHQPIKNIKKEEQKQDFPCPSTESKRIISQKQKLGYNYVPIQHRAEDLLKEKQQKIAKLQKQKQFSRILQQKQCTFKPQIKPYTKKTKVNERQQIDYKITEDERQRFEECFIDQQFLCTPTQPFNQQPHSLFQQSLYCKPENESKACARKYKNEKFNFLLDLIQ